ncbi:hypothetical protein GCM10011519_17900 [Marmoricola endophyticus]|uniref:Uncharacterized protein n=1 Tax=Marmoricola endophyticus TaxID=2040280 RepID=A0A917F1S6_9ACTN|nr:hypothetical protein [Marmoricola endophyticus]GGF44433.1 hypothetical protein GCM10011519_17900 [Marmoricola endophyticus]
MPTHTLPLPTYDGATVVVPAPGVGPGNWAGAASAVLVDGVFWLTWRDRRPLTVGRGVTVRVARSADGVRFEVVAEVHRDEFGAESFERPVLVPVPGVGWRLYLSCATPGSKHWWVDSLTAPTPEALPTGERRIVLPGSASVAVKDPVVRRRADGTWEMWLCCHPLDVADAEDRMTTRLLTSPDGLVWDDAGDVLVPRAGRWDARGARVTTVVAEDPLVVLYDGRPDAASNWYETTGVARWDGERLVPDDAEPLRSPYADGALRYAAAVRLPDGRTRFYVEAARPDGAHDLVTMLR